MRTQKGVLGDLLRIGVVPQHTEGDGPHAPTISVHDRAERSSIAPIEAAYEGGILRCLD